MTVRFGVLVAVVALAGLLITMSGWVAWHEHQNARAATVLYEAGEKLREQNAARYRKTHLPAPAMRTVATYPAPYNLEIICTVAGSTASGKPLNPDVGPKPGDLYVKTCRAYALSDGPSG